jgi:hypothetical protein
MKIAAGAATGLSGAAFDCTLGIGIGIVIDFAIAVAFGFCRSVRSDGCGYCIAAGDPSSRFAFLF